MAFKANIEYEENGEFISSPWELIHISDKILKEIPISNEMLYMYKVFLDIMSNREIKAVRLTIRHKE